ncbi:uncharacterized protein [Mytilus edulis]|uniref:uncharacterized protein isoform X3 n=1 Tax=Mytilus edulis TaxID=6550 RepID=UPI0039F10D5B
MYSFLKMVTFKMDNYGLSGIFLLVFYVRTSHTYVKRCPEMAELVIFTKVKCYNDYEYHCLALHRITFNNYKEECRPPEWVSLGNYPVLRGRYIDYETCPVSTYQPFLFRSNERYKCTYLKSICSLDGQVKVNDGTTTSDKACRCDYNRGYAFVIRPQNQSACIPSQEDCSCYSKRCEKDQHLNPDYECQAITVLHGNSTYHVVTVTSDDNTSHNGKFVMTNLNNFVSGKEGHISGLIVLKSLIVFVVLMTSAFSIASLIYPLEHLTMYTQSSQGVYKKTKKQEMNQKTETAARKTIVQPNVGISTPAILEIDQQSIREHKENNLMKTETNLSTPTEKAETNLKKTETDLSTPTEKADIIILHIEEENKKNAVESFKFHLELLSKEMGYSGIHIKMFEDIFHKKEDDSDFEIETVLKKCNYVFAYISDNFYTSKLRRLGLKELCIKDALNEEETKEHIKIVRNCKYLPNDRHLSLQQKDVDLDFFEYNKKNPGVVKEYGKTYKVCLENIQHNDKTKQYY